MSKADVELDESKLSPMEARISFLADAAILFAEEMPKVSHNMMRDALRFLKDSNMEIAAGHYLHICKRCGVVKVPCANTIVRCEKSNKRQRRKLKRRHRVKKIKEAGISVKIDSTMVHKNVMVLKYYIP
ncbi:conserved hypothetical protein [Theileria equi strain WA]|uniref:Uncharacterized protein n=1 Tax=Theileria equi strain WA TaxID=1537102 RepID=L1LCR8_THEEQ|nr:conserved hypothetical protein [Theileria equi strain WA]EKX73227.1 conserved hypothetical protein [Theileria equi strain WA]|eukprot:XP_004832679.1 conserved hypothetical protein [Theileria equi strain WA]